METVYGSVALRPTRIGFLVRPNQQNFSQVREIIRTSTCLWGGAFNPIIPVCKFLPTAWREERFQEVSGRGLTEAYIRFFEPDVFVEMEAGLAKEAGIAGTKRAFSNRVIHFRQFAKAEEGRRSEFAFGLSVFDIYKDLYRETFRFAARKPRKVAAFQNADPYCEAVFGGFPPAKKLRYLSKAYTDVCEPRIFPSTAETCLKLFRENYITPIWAGLHKVEVNFENREDPTIFVFDPTKTVDLIDFWNLRQFRSNVLPINVHWLSQFADMARKAVTSNYRPLPRNRHGVMIYTTLEFGRSIDKATRDDATNTHFRNLPAGSLSRKDWYDPIWRSNWRGGGVQPRRAKLVADEIDFEEAVDERHLTLRFPSPEPKFASRFSFANNEARWVNVIRLADYLDNSSLSVAFPPNVKGEEFPRLDGGVSLATREGIVIFRCYKMMRASLRLLSQQDAVIGWLKSRNIDARPSSSGRNAQQVLRSLGGIRGTFLLADEATVRLLDKMAKTIQQEADGTIAQYPDRTASMAEWKEVLGRRSKTSVWSRSKLNEFTEANVMRIGLSVTCPNCAKENWYSLSDADYEITCERCLKKFSFPQTGLRFNEGDWRYRVIGPFSVPNYADGAYATALTLRLFNNTLNTSPVPTTFATGLDVMYGTLKFEIDFAGWYQEGRKFWIDPGPVIVFGETKSFGTDTFKERDVQRLKSLAEALPGSYVVFSAMKKQLSQDEKSRIRKLAEWGRVPQKSGQPRAMVIVLTGTELFADHSVKQAWEQAGGAHANAVSHPSVHIDDLWTLAELTQQLYLGLTPYWQWRRNRRRARSTPA